MILQSLYISSAPAVWRLLEYTIHQEKPAVTNLPFHNISRYCVVFRINSSEFWGTASIEFQSSAILDWMQYNRENDNVRELLYCEFPNVLHSRQRAWMAFKIKQERYKKSAGDPFVTDGVFPFRMLLIFKRDTRSYEDLYAVNGGALDCFSAACIALRLIAHDSEWATSFDQIKNTVTASTLLCTLATIIANTAVTYAQSLWDGFKDNFTDDCMHRLNSYEPFNPLPADWS